MTNAPTTRETADHAELADQARRDLEWSCLTTIRPTALLALLSEIAALRGERDRLAEELHNEIMVCAGKSCDADVAERQRDELRKALEPFATYPLAVKMDGTVAPDEYQLTGRHDKEGNFRTVTNGDFQRARQAITNHGADHD